MCLLNIRPRFSSSSVVVGSLLNKALNLLNRVIV